MPDANPFLEPSPLPFSFPPFDAIRIEHYRPAVEAGIVEQLREVQAVLADPRRPTFENTIEALERSGRTLVRTVRVFENLSASMATEQMQDLERELAPRLAAHRDDILLDSALFGRVHAVHSFEAGRAELTGEQQRVLERYHRDFVRAGGALPAEDRDRLRELNADLSTATTQFGTSVLADANARALHLTARHRLDGLGDDVVEAAATAATAAGLDGYLLTLRLPTVQPALSALTDRETRRALHEAATTRGSTGAHDTRALVGRIAGLRAERAHLLGFENHAAYVVDDQTAGTTKAVLAMLEEMVGPAMRNLAVEADRIEQLMHDDGVPGPVRPWDWAYYAERDRQLTYDVDAGDLRAWFELERVLHDGIFFAASRLYGVSFRERTDLPVYADDVRVFEVLDEPGNALGLFVCDWYARPVKRGGAWMAELVAQSTLLETLPVVVVCLNVSRPAAGQPTLMTVEEVRTAFHEFGHALHGLFSTATYPRLQGTSVPRDFVEFPSQVNEMWAWWPEVLASYAVHHVTGEPLAQHVVDRLVASQSHGQGFDTVSMLGAALLDQEWHLTGREAARVEAEEVEAFEARALAAHGVASVLVPPRYRSTYFAHIFAGGYDAGYYSYLWSEVLDADMVDWFRENGGLTRDCGSIFRDRLLSLGGTVDPVAAFIAVRGRGPTIEPLLRRRGLLT